MYQSSESSSVPNCFYDRDNDHGQLISPYEILYPETQRIPFVYSSPHSGKLYPPEFIKTSRLKLKSLRGSEDCYVDELFSAAPNAGAPLIKAVFPRVFIDANREPYEFDPSMFVEPLPSFVTTSSNKISAGLGTIAKVVSYGEKIYSGKLHLSDALNRVNNYYLPYHDSLEKLINITKESFGGCALIDCHSMPSNRIGNGSRNNKSPADIVLGDNHGRSASKALVNEIEDFFISEGLSVKINDPYPGGYTTSNYGKPKTGVQAIQIEINRALYMDEKSIKKNEGFLETKQVMDRLVSHLSKLIIV